MGIDNLGGESEVCVGGRAVFLYGGVPLAVRAMEELCVPRNGAAGVAVRRGERGCRVPNVLGELMVAEKRTDGAVYVEVRVLGEEGKLVLVLACSAWAAWLYLCARSYFGLMSLTMLGYL